MTFRVLVLNKYYVPEDAEDAQTRWTHKLARSIEAHGMICDILPRVRQDSIEDALDGYDAIIAHGELTDMALLARYGLKNPEKRILLHSFDPEITYHAEKAILQGNVTYSRHVGSKVLDEFLYPLLEKR